MAPTRLSFIGSTHPQANCPPVLSSEIPCSLETDIVYASGGGGVEGMRGYNSKKLDLGESILEMHKRQRDSSLCESCQTIISMMEANPPCLPVSFKSKQKNAPPRFYLYAIIITFNILASCEHQLLSFSLFTKYLVHFFCLSY